MSRIWTLTLFVCIAFAIVDAVIFYDAGGIAISHFLYHPAYLFAALAAGLLAPGIKQYVDEAVEIFMILLGIFPTYYALMALMDLPLQVPIWHAGYTFSWASISLTLLAVAMYCVGVVAAYTLYNPRRTFISQAH